MTYSLIVHCSIVGYVLITTFLLKSNLPEWYLCLCIYYL